MSINLTYYHEDVKRIDKIEFSIYRNKDVKLYSAVSDDPFGIDLAESYENYEPKKGGLVDLRLGTCDIYLQCSTCGENSLNCPGHFGHTDLAEPVFHFGFLNHLKNILQCICHKCSNLLIEKSDVLFKKALNKKPELRFKEIKHLTKNVNYCFTCGVPVPKVKREVKDNGSIKIVVERALNTSNTNEVEDLQAFAKKIKESLSPRECYNILRNVSDNDCYLLGFNTKMQRPEDLIIEVFPIPPVIIRPTAKVDFMSAATMEDGLTLKLAAIITANKRVRQQIERETLSNELSSFNQEIINLLQYQVATFYDNESLSLPRTEFKSGGKSTKSISDNIKGKTGRVRNNLMGKRVDFSARTVITPDPYINIDQVGIPKKIAMELTIPEEVTPHNIKYLNGLIKNGRNIYPGANFVLRINYRDGKPEIQKIDLKYRKKSIRLKLDDVVERHCVDGDYVLFNRQPTLHKPSMMGHKIQVIDCDDLSTFRMNVSVCKPYNADFDGDEMNIHLPQSIQTRNEIKRIANVKYQIISAKDSSPIIGCVEDTLSGAYMLTDPSVRIIGWEVANILANTTNTNMNIDMNKEYTGHELFSFIIPEGINITLKSDNKIKLQIINGKLISGYLNKSLLSTSKNSIIQFIWDKYGPNKTSNFIDDAQKLILNYLLLRGQTVGFKDTVIEDEMQNKIQQIIYNDILKSKYNITQFENDIEQLSLDIIEKTLVDDLNTVHANIGKILQEYLNADNFFWTCVESGTKGSSANLAKIIGIVGQQMLSGSRIKKTIEGRSLIYFHKDDDTPEARGFIKNSYLSGLRGFEFFISSAAGREGLIDTAIRSVSWETPIIIIDDNKPMYVKIGEWIDNLIYNNKESVKYDNKLNMELLEINNVYISTTDYLGNVNWGNISAVTKHDPGDELYEIITKSGRKVIVTKTKSLLIWNNKLKEFREKITSEIIIGDFVPVTIELCDPPNILNYIKLDNYKFNLDYENGILIGLYLSIGEIITSSEIKSVDMLYHKLIKFNNLNNECKNFIIKWCNTYNLYYEIIENNIFIFSNIISKYFEDIKTFPKEIYLSSVEFIKGIITGYSTFSLIINANNIQINCNNDQSIHEFNFLLNRIGIYSNIVDKTLIICDEYIQIFNNNITLLDNNKNIVIYNLDITKTNLKYNNVMLDKIIEINKIDINLHKKMYDLTIPSTFNFSLANGLQVRDTAQTGYIQRQLIKGLEDLSIKYDGTNRNAKGIIIQTIYGENGINQASQSEIQLNILLMNNKDIEKNLCFTNDQLKKLEKVLFKSLKNDKEIKISLKNLTESNNKHKSKLINFRDQLREIQSKALINYKIIEEKYALPVNLYRITQDYSNKKECLELNPDEILEAIEDFLIDYDNRLIISLKQTDKLLKNDDRCMKFILEIALNEYLSPVKCIFEYGLSKLDFIKIMQEIKMSFIKAIIEPGEMVGIIAAQSIGEPTSQMSTCKSTEIKMIIKNKEIITFTTQKIGIFCDELIKKYPILTLDTGYKNSVETEISNLDEEYYIVGVDKNEKTHWNRISHISRHPVNGNMMKIITKSGRSTKSTLSHSHLVRRNQTVEPIVGANLKVGMRIPVAKYIDNTFIKECIEIDNKKYKLDYLFGWFIGAYLAEGNINDNQINIINISEIFINNTKLFAKKFNKEIIIKKYQDEHEQQSTITSFSWKPLADLLLDKCYDESFTKCVPNFVFIAPNEFKAGLIQAYIDSNGNYNIYDTLYEIQIYSHSEQLSKDISLLLNYFGVFCSIKSNLSKGSTIYNLVIDTQYASLFEKHIGSLIHTEKLSKMVAYAEKYDVYNLVDEIDKINGLGDIIAKCGKELQLENYNNNYEQWINKESIDRITLIKYIEIFEAHKDKNKIINEIQILNQAATSGVIWDEIKEIEIYTPDQTEYVYDFTVPANQTFMVDNGIIVHNTLNTKHFAGSATKSSANMGVNRIQELLHYSKNIKTPQMIIYFNEPYNTDRIKLNKIASYLKHLTIRQLISNVEVYYDLCLNDDLSKMIKSDNVSNPFFVNNQKAEINLLPFIIRIKLDIEKMLDKETTMLDIKTKFISHWYKNYTNLKNLKKLEKEVISRINRCAILSNNISDTDQYIHIRFSMNTFNYTVITDFMKMIIDDITLKGIENINNIDIIQEMHTTYNKETGDIVVDKEFVVYTAGININKLKYIKGIDFSRTKCNDIDTILKSYGIEATRQILLHELSQTYQSGASNINNNHLSLLIDQMCHLGEIISIDRHGLSKIEMDTIAKASFEKTMDHFVNAAIFNDKDYMKSISSRIAVGRVISGGTGCFDLLLDTKKLENSEYIEDETGGRITYIPLEEDPLIKDIIKYNNGKHDFFIP